MTLNIHPTIRQLQERKRNSYRRRTLASRIWALLGL